MKGQRSHRTNSTYRSIFMLSLWLIAGPSNELHAQNATTGGLTGVVIDPNGAVVKDVAVTLQDNAKGTTITSSTNAAGAYLFSFLFPSSTRSPRPTPGFGQYSAS